MEVFGGWASSSRGGCVNPSSLQPSSWACCFTPRASPDLAPTNVTYFTRPDLTPTAYRLNILGRQSESNSHSFSDLIISSDRSSYTDDGPRYIRGSTSFFQIFTQSIGAIDVTSVTLSRLNSINAIDI